VTAVRSHGAISTVDLQGGTGLWERGAVQVHLGFSLFGPPPQCGAQFRIYFKVSVQTRYPCFVKVLEMTLKVSLHLTIGKFP
jgi:hypothetical protein